MFRFFILLVSFSFSIPLFSQPRVVDSGIPSGIVASFVGDTCPAGWLNINVNQNLSRTQFPKLFKQAKTVHGAGDGITTFGLPNLAGLVIRVQGSQSFGSKTYTANLNTKRNDAFESHDHFVVRLNNSIGYRGALNNTNSISSYGNAEAADFTWYGLQGTSNTNHSFIGKSSSSGQGQETHGADFVLIACVKY